jgi:heptosyltransferase-2
VLLGGPAEHSRNIRIQKLLGYAVIYPGYNENIRIFAALLNFCDVVVSGDTLAMHLGIALGKRVVALFGPTASDEVYLYGHGVKLSSKIECAPCYKNTCSKKPSCLDALKPNTVIAACRKQLAKIKL